MFTGVLSVARGVGVGPFSRRGPLPENLRSFLAGENSGDVLDRSADVVREERDRTDHGERDHGEDHAVLRHRLPLLAIAERVSGGLHEGEELQHLCHLLSLIDAHAVAREIPEGKIGWSMERWCRTSRSILRAMRLVTPGMPPKCSGRGRAAYGSVAAFIVSIGPPAHPSYRGSPTQLPCLGEGEQEAAPIVLPSPYGPRMQTPRSAPTWRPTGARRTGAKGNATTEVLDQAVPPAPSPDLARQDDPHRDRSGPGLGRLGRAEARVAARGAAQVQAPLRPDAVLQRDLLRRARALRGRGEHVALGTRDRRVESRGRDGRLWA